MMVTLILLFGLAAASPAPASVEAARHLYERAEKHYERGRVELDPGELETALGLFRELHDMRPHPNLLFNMGQCHRLLGHAAEAKAAYEGFLASGPPEPDRSDAAAYVAEMKLLLARQATPERATPALPVEAVAAPPPSPRRDLLALSDADLAPMAPTMLSAPPPAPPPPRPLYARPWVWIAAGVVVAAAVGVYLWSASRDDDTCAIRPLNKPCTPLQP